jgi:predicted transcriptional regulator YdeE
MVARHEVQSFNIIGISVRTTNHNAQMGIDIPALWHKFISDNIIEQIPNKIDNTIYCIYTEYEGDYTKPYTALLGCKVSTLEEVPHGLIGKEFGKGAHNKYVAKGNILQGSVFEQWQHIWSLDIPRVYSYDFEVYGEKAQDLENAEVDIFIAVG